MKSIEERLKDLDLSKVEITIPRVKATEYDKAYMRAIYTLKALGVSYDVFTSGAKKMTSAESKRSKAYWDMVEIAKDKLIAGEILSDDLKQKIIFESNWYNNEILNKGKV